MAFDWVRFCESNRVDYVDSGPNVSRGHIAIPCPFCGPEDSSQHMSVSLEGKGWRCFRNHQHRGKNPARLIMAVLGCSLDSALRLTGDAVYVPEDFLGAVAKQFAAPGPAIRQGLELPAEFKAFRGLPSSRPFVRYLIEDRGFKDPHRLSDEYGLRYCVRGKFGGRIIFPIECEGKLVSWTGRTIVHDQDLRYKALSTDPERSAPYPAALGPAPDYLLWFDHLMTSDAPIIVLVEGPFDALKVSVLGKRYGIVSTCFFTSSPSNSQVEFLHELLPRFEHRYLLLDRGTTAIGLQVLAQLSGLGVELLTLPAGIKDPGVLKISPLLDLIPLACDNSAR